MVTFIVGIFDWTDDNIAGSTDCASVVALVLGVDVDAIESAVDVSAEVVG